MMMISSPVLFAIGGKTDSARLHFEGVGCTVPEGLEKARNYCEQKKNKKRALFKYYSFIIDHWLFVCVVFIS